MTRVETSGVIDVCFLYQVVVMFHCPKSQFPIINTVIPETGGRGGQGRCLAL